MTRILAGQLVKEANVLRIEQPTKRGTDLIVVNSSAMFETAPAIVDRARFSSSSRDLLFHGSGMHRKFKVTERLSRRPCVIYW